MSMHPLRATKSVDSYLAAQTPKERAALQKVRHSILAAAPAAQEGISYGIPAYTWHGPLFYLAAHSKHLSLHGVNPRLQAEFAAELARFEIAGSTLHFRPERPPSAALLKKLVKRRLDFNAEKMLAKAEAKALRKRKA